jgi:CO/xanthine dehydrogenase Mo-binding subunit
MAFSDGLLINNNLLEYRVPSVRDLPAASSCVIVENADGPGPFGAKGCGEGALAGIVAAIATAVADAGVPGIVGPLTPERVWRAINRQDDQHQKEATT